MSAGGSPAARLYQTNIEQMREEAEREGLICPADIAAARQLLNNPDFVVPMHVIMFTASGRRPL